MKSILTKEAPCDEEVMRRLRNRIGKKIIVNHIRFSEPKVTEGILKEVHNFCHIRVGVYDLYFIIGKAAIRKISNKKGGVLYYNPLITKDFPQKTEKEREKIRRETFGIERYVRMLAEEKVSWAKEDFKDAKLDAESIKSTPNFIREGIEVVKPKLKGKWEKFVVKEMLEEPDCDSPEYSGHIIKSALQIMKALSKGKSFRKALSAGYNPELSAGQGGRIISIVGYFHSRGRKFFEWDKNEHN